MIPFNYKTHAVKVIFGKPIFEALEEELPDNKPNIAFIGSRRYGDLVEKLKLHEKVGEVFHFDKVIQHVPQGLVEEAGEFLEDKEVNIILCLGGGSAIGLGKALILNSSAEFWAVPTTYSGSEMTNIYGISHNGVKTVKRNDRVHPQKVFYDPFLSLRMPLDLAVPSAFNAMAHLVEALYSPESNPIINALADLGLKILLEGLKSLSEEKVMTSDINEKLMFGAYVGGKVLCEVSMGLHHKAAHVLGGNFNLEHSKIHTLLLPYVLKYQWDFLNENTQQNFQSIFENPLPYKTLRALQENLGSGFSLQDLGLSKEDIPKAVDFLMQMTYPNPAPMIRDHLNMMLESAY
ncbi:maleylacetate reductase [Cecembia rubra]|uniref:maleylacetate reductase n=1 Tax=Cecembia rubra TaxID=1485585 RepID=UPI0027151DB5|nr:maleylacetate reductase [Cecembia rubra]